jgi:prepilin-type N-terminal cleavage/methylation domain-containing protein
MALSHRQGGFTLSELLVTLGIVGILVAIALPAFSAYKSRSFNAVALTDLRNSASSQEAFYVNETEYVSCTGAEQCENALPGFTASRVSGRTVMSQFSHTAAGDRQSFTAQAAHSKGDTTYDYDSRTGKYVSSSGGDGSAAF